MASTSANSTESDTKLFDGTTDYNEWLTKMKSILEQNGVANVLDDNEPTDPPKIRDFKYKQDKARKLILESLTDDVLVLLRYKNSPKEIITTLSKVNELKGGLRLGIAEEIFRNLLYINDRPLRDFLRLFEKLASNVRAAGGTMDDEEMICQLLASMPPDYENTVAALDALCQSDESNISYEFCKDSLLAEEDRLVMESGEDLGTTDFFFYPFN